MPEPRVYQDDPRRPQHAGRPPQPPPGYQQTQAVPVGWQPERYDPEAHRQRVGPRTPPAQPAPGPGFTPAPPRQQPAPGYQPMPQPRGYQQPQYAQPPPGQYPPQPRYAPQYQPPGGRASGNRTAGYGSPPGRLSASSASSRWSPP